MPATATSAVATAASAVADAVGFSAAYLRSCRHSYSGAGVLLLSRDRRKPQNVCLMFAGSKASQVRAGCEVAKVTADELKSKPNAVLRRTSKEPTKEDIKQRVAKLDGMTVFSALKLNLPGGVGVHGGVYTASDMKYDIECGYLVMQVEGADEPTASEVDGGDAGGSGGLTARSARRQTLPTSSHQGPHPGYA